MANNELDTEESKKWDHLKTIVEHTIEVKKRADQNGTTANNQTVENSIIEGEKTFNDYKPSSEKEAKFWYLLGKMYNCSMKFRIKAKEALCQAVKYDPDSIDSWNELGECYWYCLNVEMAKQCFERAVDKKENKISIRNLSVVIRKQASNSETDDGKSNLEHAAKLAKRAVELDPTDGVSWSILGNAYLAVFFGLSQDEQVAVQAISAYKMAEKNLTSKENHELHYNKGIALKYTEQFSEAIEALARAANCEESWTLPKKTYQSLVQYLDSVVKFYGHKGKLKPKRFYSMKKDLDNLLLGPYSDSSTYNLTKVKDLSKGVNSKRVLYGKVVWSFQMDTSFPFTFGLVDANEDEVVVTTFNLSVNKSFLIGDSVAIPNPVFSEVVLTHLGKEYTFKKVRVNYPPHLVVNNKKLSPSTYGQVKFDTSPC